jgi:hypothetical protein
VWQAALSNLWPKTVGFWDLTDPATFYGTVRVPLSTIQGGCTERYATHTHPASVPDISYLYGGFTLVPPKCKSGLPAWSGVRQPSLLFPGRAGGGVSFHPAITPGGLVLLRSLRELGAANLLPLSKMTIEMFVSFDDKILPGTKGGLLDATYRAPAFFGRGVSLYWTAGSEPDVVQIAMSLSTELTEQPVRGGVVTVRTPPLHVQQMTRGAYVYVAGMYNGTHASLYVNGTLLASERVCDSREHCGNITWPVNEEVSYADTTYEHIASLTDLRHIHMTLGYADGASHMGGLATARIIREALSDRQIKASAARNVAAGAIAKGVPKCPPGSEGPYDGEEPCSPCDAGTR